MNTTQKNLKLEDLEKDLNKVINKYNLTRSANIPTEALTCFILSSVENFVDSYIYILNHGKARK
jgi:hypothetical protein